MISMSHLFYYDHNNRLGLVYMFAKNEMIDYCVITVVNVLIMIPSCKWKPCLNKKVSALWNRRGLDIKSLFN